MDGIRTEKLLQGSLVCVIIHKQLHLGYLTTSCRNCFLLFFAVFGMVNLKYLNGFKGTVVFLHMLHLFFFHMLHLKHPQNYPPATSSSSSHDPFECHIFSISAPLAFHASLYYITLSKLYYRTDFLHYTPLQRLWIISCLPSPLQSDCLIVN